MATEPQPRNPVPVKSVTKTGTEASGEPRVAKKIMKTAPSVIKETQTKAEGTLMHLQEQLKWERLACLEVLRRWGGWNPPRAAAGKAQCAATRKI